MFLRRIRSLAVLRYVVVIFLAGSIFISMTAAAATDTSGFNARASYELMERLLPGAAAHFEVVYIDKENDKDVFEVEGNGGKIVLRGNDGVAIASAFNYYLKNYLHYKIGWNAVPDFRMPDVLPAVSGKIRRTSPYKYRYFFNYCTFNYSASWWDWDRWQRTVDWMALNGINMPLALTGQNSVWYRVYKSMGFTEEEMKNFFTGPAYFNWFWMGNLDGWGGPLSQGFMNKHEKMQKKILARERELGMKPILPAFTGHVPASFNKHFPKAKLFKTSWGDDFPSVAFSSMLDPNDSLFLVIGKKFIEEQTRTFGTDHFYSADTFNEMVPPSGDSVFLDQVGKKIYHAMSTVDTAATWVMQGWMFGYNPDFWKPAQMKALLNTVPGDKLIILDLWAEVNPLWNNTEALYGKSWIWCMLHNFGGTNSLYGDLQRIATDPAKALHDAGSGRMAGMGLTMEAIDQNPVVYSLMLDNVWRNQPIELDEWLKQYAYSRYGKEDLHAQQAWATLKKTVYSGQPWWGTASIITGRPTFEKEAKWTHTELHYKPADLLPAWEQLMNAAEQLGEKEEFQYDLVDVTRQVLANYANHIQRKFSRYYKANDWIAYKKETAVFLSLIDDMDRLLATRREFLLGKWLGDARNYGDDEKEKDLFEQNARDLITLWGDKDCGIHDYAYKQWAGLLKGYYKPRWIRFFNYVDECRASTKKFDQSLFEKNSKEWEWKWVKGKENYSPLPAGDPVKTVEALYKKYFAIIKKEYAVSRK
jgi:alpha-N-acetylglucosaminidase